MDQFKEFIAIIGYGIEAVGVLIILVGATIASFHALVSKRHEANEVRYKVFRTTLGRSIILGLEFLIAGDIIRTVIVSDTLENIAILGLIILIRTVLSLTLFLEVEGRWPWQPQSCPDTQANTEK